MDEAVGAEGVGVWPCGTKRGTAFTGIPARRPQARPATLHERGVALPGALRAIPRIHPLKAARAGQGDLFR